MDPDSTSRLVILVVLLLLSAFFTAAESALQAFNKGSLRHLVSELNKNALLVKKILQDPRNIFDTILVCDCLVNICAAVVGTTLAVSLWGQGWGLFYAIVFLTIVIVVFGQILPNTVAARQPEKYAFALIRPLHLMMVMTYPLVKFLYFLAGLIFKIKGIKPLSTETPVIEEEIINLVAAGQEEGVIEQEEKTMIHGVFDFTDTVVKDVMVPRPDIVAVSKTTTYPELLEVIKKEQFSRIPVFDGNIDNILGVVHIKDLIMAGGSQDSAFSPEDYLRQPFFVPETKKVNELFRAMKKDKVHMAVVLDEYGSTAGLVTLEDLIEEIMGEIQDEHDTEEPDFRKIDADTFEINAGVHIEELNERLGLDLKSAEAETLGGLVFAELDRVPAPGDRVSLPKVELTVSEMEGHRIEKLRLVKMKNVEKGQPA